MTNEEKNTGTTRHTFAKYNRFWHLKVIETKTRQNMVFDPGGLSGCLCGCPFWEGDPRCKVGGLISEAFATRYSYLRSFRSHDISIFLQTVDVLPFIGKSNAMNTAICYYCFLGCTKTSPRVI